jgi:dTDP-4-dehydrorhamnose reductase
MRRVVLIGANGQLGTDLSRRFEWTSTLIPLTHADVEICDHDRLRAVLGAIGPDVVINTAAFDVEACERDVRRSLAVNCHAVRNLALVCNDLDAQLVHFSTDDVFGDGQATSHPETAIPNPLNVYGVSKLLGEHFVRCLCDNYLLIRSSELFGLKGISGRGGNVVETMLRRGKETGNVSVEGDHVLSPTYTADLAQMVHRLVEARARGLFHVTNAGSCSRYEFATAIFVAAGMSVTVSQTSARLSCPTVRFGAGQLEAARGGVRRSPAVARGAARLYGRAVHSPGTGCLMTRTGIEALVPPPWDCLTDH